MALLLLSTGSCLAQREAQSSAHRIDGMVRARAAAGDFNGTVLVARRGRIVYQHGFGNANLEWNIHNDLQTKFEIGSMTKQFTAMLILPLVNDGKIRLDGHIADHVAYYRHDSGLRLADHSTSEWPILRGNPPRT